MTSDISAADAKVRTDVDKFGWHCLNVWPSKGEDGPAFSYTIGLTFGHPEVMVFGLEDKAHGILSECVGLVRNGKKLIANTPNAEVLSGGYDVIFKPVRQEPVTAFSDVMHNSAPGIPSTITTRSINFEMRPYGWLAQCSQPSGAAGVHGWPVPVGCERQVWDRR
jgi:hypothetical protein